MKPCASCKTPAACAKAGKCMAAKPMSMPKKGGGTPAGQKKTGRFYAKRTD
jgi:hypothetical protein